MNEKYEKYKRKKRNEIGYFLFGLLITLVAVSIVTYIFDIVDDFFETMIFVACSGGIGGLMYSIRGFYQSIVKKEFSTRYSWWYFFRPLLSIVAGVFLMFLVKGGLFAIGVSSDVEIANSTMFYSGLAFLTGFGFSQFNDKLFDIVEVLFSKGEEEG